MARTEAQAMLRVARRDLRAARLLAVDEAEEASWGFQMQQAIEKAFKASQPRSQGPLHARHRRTAAGAQ